MDDLNVAGTPIVIIESVGFIWSIVNRFPIKQSEHHATNSDKSTYADNLISLTANFVKERFTFPIFLPMGITAAGSLWRYSDRAHNRSHIHKFTLLDNPS